MILIVENNKTISKAKLYTPRLKMSFCTSQQITPILRSKPKSALRKPKSSERSKKSQSKWLHTPAADYYSKIKLLTCIMVYLNL